MISKAASRPRTLVILLCQDRELDRTLASLEKNVLGPLNGSLALCGVSTPVSKTRAFDYQWGHPEPESWRTAINAAGITDTELARLDTLDYQFMSGLDEPDHAAITNQRKGSGAIVLYWRWFLGKELRESPALEHFDWFLVTRSDFLWEVPHMTVENLSEDAVYFFDGEHYGGVCDRYVLFHRKNAHSVFSVCDDLFEDADSVFERFVGSESVNPEFFLEVEWRRRGVMAKAQLVPYLANAIRSSDGKSRWTLGTWAEDLNAFVKYPMERRQALIYRKRIRHPEDWGRYPMGRMSIRHLAARLEWKLLEAWITHRDTYAYKARFRIIARRKLMKRFLRRLKLLRG